MPKYVKVIIAIVAIILGWIFGYISWGGVYDFGNPTNTILFSCSSPLMVGGIIYLIVVLVKRKKPVV